MPVVTATGTAYACATTSPTSTLSIVTPERSVAWTRSATALAAPAASPARPPAAGGRRQRLVGGGAQRSRKRAPPEHLRRLNRPQTTPIERPRDPPLPIHLLDRVSDRHRRDHSVGAKPLQLSQRSLEQGHGRQRPRGVVHDHRIAVS